MNAIRWLSKQAADAGTPLTDEAMNRANRAASESAGADALARREQARLEHAEQTELELRKLRGVLRSLRGIERAEQRVLRPCSLDEAVSQDLFGLPNGVHWARLADLERAAEAFSEGFRASCVQPPAAKRRRGERASGDERAASNRFVAAFFASAVGRAGMPSELAITEIALGRAARCVDASEFDERRKRWSKAKRRPR